MDLRRFHDLYVSETAEHQKVLQRALLALEQEPGSGAIDEAFRSAHTLKGLAAAMGHTAVADLAHRLEDQLDRIRQHGGRPDALVVDELLQAFDVLASALTASYAVEGTTPSETPTDGPAHELAAPIPAAPAGTAATAVIRLQTGTPLKAARAVLILRALADHGVLGSDPTSYTDDFTGTFHVFFGPTTDLHAAAAAIRGAGDVASVDFIEASDPASSQAKLARRHVRVEARRLDRVAEQIGELQLLAGRLAAAHDVPPALADLVGRLDTVLTQLQHDTLALRMVPVREAFERLPRVVRDAARQTDRAVDLTIAGEDVELDRPILEEIGEPLVHLLRNAVDHGIEAAAARRAAGKPERGRIEIRAERERSSVRITVRDDGAGVDHARVVAKAKSAGLPVSSSTPTDEELFRLLSHAGLSTSEQVTELSGRGVGLDVVASRIRALGGAIEMHTTAGRGTTFSIRLPITLALAQALRVRVGGEEYVIPLTHLAEAVELNGNVDSARDREHVLLRGDAVPLVRMRQLLGVAGPGAEETAVITDIGGRKTALAFDELIGSEQILIKSFDAVAGVLPYFAGATLLADGRPALVLDPLGVL